MDIIDIVLARSMTMGEISGADRYKILISATYASIEEMEADFDNPDIPANALVLIKTEDPEEEDNEKVYLKGESEWEFVGDLTAIPGPQGKSGVIVSEMEPDVEEEGVIWVNPLRNTQVNIPLIKDDEVSETDTWSSEKINSLFASEEWTFVLQDGTTVTKAVAIVQ